MSDVRGFDTALDIRACTDADLSGLHWRWPLAGDVHGSHHRQPDSLYLVAWVGQEPVGSVLLRWSGPVGTNARERYPDVAALLHLHVREPYRGRGVGTALVQAVELRAGAHGSDQLVLAVGVENPGAQGLYRRLGYQPTGISDVTEYDWIGDDGRTNHAVETDQLFIRAVRAVKAETDCPG